MLHFGGLFHDIGKIAIRDDVLLKPGKLTPDEFKEIQRHPVAGRELLKGMRTIEAAMPIVYHHHERYDGSGYPEGRMGENIPLLARVASVADVYDALTTSRPYRAAMTRSEALDVMEREKDEGLVGSGAVRRSSAARSCPCPRVSSPEARKRRSCSEDCISGVDHTNDCATMRWSDSSPSCPAPGRGDPGLGTRPGIVHRPARQRTSRPAPRITREQRL